MGKLTVFIFDWSGVVSDDRRPVYVANMRILGEYGKRLLTFGEWLSKSASNAAEFLASQGVEGSCEDLSNLYKKCLDDAIASGTGPFVYPDVKDTFIYLKDGDKKLAVLSAHPEENLIKEANDYGLFDYLDGLVGDSKNKAEDLKRIVGGFKEKPESCLYTGDTIYDIRAAKKAGLISAGISGPPGKQRGYHSRGKLEAENCDFLLESLTDLKDIVDLSINLTP